MQIEIDKKEKTKINAVAWIAVSVAVCCGLFITKNPICLLGFTFAIDA